MVIHGVLAWPYAAVCHEMAAIHNNKSKKEQRERGEVSRENDTRTTHGEEFNPTTPHTSSRAIVSISILNTSLQIP